MTFFSVPEVEDFRVEANGTVATVRFRTALGLVSYTITVRDMMGVTAVTRTVRLNDDDLLMANSLIEETIAEGLTSGTMYRFEVEIRVGNTLRVENYARDEQTITIIGKYRYYTVQNLLKSCQKL